jgi:hypothetical protein
MKKVSCCSLLIGILAYSVTGFAEPPRHIAGFTLGANISQFKEQVRMDSEIPIRHMEYLAEVEAKKLEGYKSGYILFGTCDEPGRIVKIRLKYANSERRFFDELLERFKKKFGQPGEWKGDPFQALISWKWSFTDQHKNKIVMILQHYGGEDEEYTRGNSLRMVMRGLIEKERLCYEKKYPEPPEPVEHLTGKKKSSAEHQKDMQRFVPE